METRSIWNMFSLETQPDEVVFLKYIQNIMFLNELKKNRWRQLVSNLRRLTWAVILSSPLFKLCYFGAEGGGFITDI